MIGETPEWTLWVLVGLMAFVMLLPGPSFEDCDTRAIPAENDRETAQWLREIART